MYENQAMSEICQNKLKLEDINYIEINKVWALSIANTMASNRHDNIDDMDAGKLVRNVVPYPRIHFLSPSFAPFTEKESSDVNSLIKAAMAPENSLITVMHDKKSSKLK